MLKSSAYPPLDSLVDLACRDGVDIRPTLLRVLTDLYVQKPAHSADEEAQYIELALGLIDASTSRPAPSWRRGLRPTRLLPPRSWPGCPSPPRRRPRHARPDRDQTGAAERPRRNVLCRRHRRTPADIDQSRRRGRGNGTQAGAGHERSHPPSRSRGAQAQRRANSPAFSNARSASAGRWPSAPRAIRPASRWWSPPARSV